MIRKSQVKTSLAANSQMLLEYSYYKVCQFWCLFSAKLQEILGWGLYMSWPFSITRVSSLSSIFSVCDDITYHTGFNIFLCVSCPQVSEGGGRV